MSLILVGGINDEVVGARAVDTGNGCPLRIEGKATGWQMQIDITQWMSAHSSQQSGARGLAA
ncbi:hypothetical protein ACSFA0_23980 [Variovorax sp. LT1P1]|uniref:hypothetical protein n=1 Tax=Variovorax sp. LT1P1 TaxID=3443730 RepID=UPI003F48B0CF